MRWAICGKKVSVKIVQQLRHFEDAVENVSVRLLKPGTNTGAKLPVQFADQQSSDDKKDRPAKASSEWIHRKKCLPTWTQQPSINQVACYEFGENFQFSMDNFPSIAQEGDIHKRILHLMVPDRGIIMNDITEVIITDIMIEKRTTKKWL